MILCGERGIIRFVHDPRCEIQQLQITPDSFHSSGLFIFVPFSNYVWKVPKTKIPQQAAGVIWFCGERGIRTPGTLLRYTRFPGVPVKPLLHLSLFQVLSYLKIGGANYKNIFNNIVQFMRFLRPEICSDI